MKNPYAAFNAKADATINKYDQELQELRGTYRRRRETTSRDKYGNTRAEIAAERARIYKKYGQGAVAQDKKLGEGIISVADVTPPGSSLAPKSPYTVLVSDEYASKHRAERLSKSNILETTGGPVGDTQFINPNPAVDRNSPTTWVGRQADYIDDKFDDVWKYIFGQPKPKGNKQEQEEAFRADQNLQVNEDGIVVDSRQATINDMRIDKLREELMNSPEDPDADQVIYYGRVDNPDGTSSYKIGLASVDPFSRTADEDRGKDITYLWSKRTKDAAKYEALFHGNRELLKTRRNDIGMDPEAYGAGHTEIYNMDFLGLDGSVSEEKIRTLNISSQKKLAELGFSVSGRQDTKNMELAYRELDKKKSIYGENSPEVKELEYLLSNMEKVGKDNRSFVDKKFDLIQGVGSSIQQAAAGIGDAVLDAVTVGNNTWLDDWKNPQTADKMWGYDGRPESEALGREALRAWKNGNYVDALVKGIKAAPDVIVQSSADMAMLFSGIGTARGAASIAMKARAASLVKTAAQGNKLTFAQKQAAMATAMKTPEVLEAGAKAAAKWEKRTKLGKYLDPRQNIGLSAFATKQTNNQIDERIQNGDDVVDLSEIALMWANNYVLGGIDRFAIGKELNVKPIKAMISALPEEGVIAAAAKGAGIVGSLVRAGSIESAQEFVQTYGETINAGIGTEKFGSNPFSEHFLDEATRGALLGFGAGGVMHGSAIAGEAVTKGLRAAKDNAKAKKDKPLADTETSLGEVSPFHTVRQVGKILEPLTSETILNDVDKTLKDKELTNPPEGYYTAIDKVLDAAFRTKKIDEDTYKSYKDKVEEHKNPHIKDLKNILDPHVTNSTEGTNSKSRFRKFVGNAGGHLKNIALTIKEQMNSGKLTEKELKDFFVEETLTDSSSKYVKNMYLIGKALGLLDSSQGAVIQEIFNDRKNNKNTVEDKVEKSLDDIFMDELDSIDDVFESVTPEGSSVENYIQFLLLLGEKAKKREGKFVDENKTTVDEVVDFLRSIPDRIVAGENSRLSDALGGMSNFVTIEKVGTAFAAMSRNQAEAIIGLQQELLQTPLSMSSFKARAHPTDKKTADEVTYDIIIGDGTFHGKSLQEYLHRAISAMSLTDPAARARVLAKIKDDLVTWMEFDREDTRTTGLESKRSAEDALKVRTLEVINALAADTKVDFKEETKYEPKPNSKPKPETVESLAEDIEVSEEELAKVNEDIAELKKMENDGKLDAADKTKLEKLLEKVEKITKTLIELRAKSQKAIDQREKEEEENEKNKFNEDGTPKSEIEQELDRGVRNKTITETIRAKLDDIFGSVKKFTFNMTPSDIAYGESIINEERNAQSQGKLRPLSAANILDQGNIPPNPNNDLYANEAADFLQRMKDSVDNILDIGFEINGRNIVQNPEMAYLFQMKPEDRAALGDVLLYSISKLMAKKITALAAAESFDADIGKHTLGVVGLNEKDTLALHNLGMYRGAFLEELASIIAKELNIKGDKYTQQIRGVFGEDSVTVDTGKAFTENLSMQLASVLAIELTKTRGSKEAVLTFTDRTFESGDIKGENIPFVKLFQSSGGGYHKIVKSGNAAHKLQKSIDKIFGKTPEKSGFYKSTEDMAKQQTRLDDGTPIGKKAKKALETARGIIYRVNPASYGIFKMNKEQLLKLFKLNPLDVPPLALLDLGFTLEEITAMRGKKHNNYTQALRDYEAYVKSEHALTDANVLKFKGKILKSIQTIKTIMQLREVLKDDLYMDNEIGGNARLYVQVFDTESVQGDKFFRPILQTENMAVDVTIGNKSKAFGFWKLDMVQALSKFLPDSVEYTAEDKNTPERTDAVFETMIANIMETNSDIMKIVKKIANEDNLTDTEVEQLALVVDFTDTHTLTGLLDLLAYNEAKEKGDKTFESRVFAESDAATSAVAFKSAQNGSIEDAARSMLVTGQITTVGLEQLKSEIELINDPDSAAKIKLLDDMINGTVTASLPAINEAGIHVEDSYQATVLKFVADMKESNKPLYEVLELLFGELIDENGKVTKNGRDFAKQPQMQYLYGQQEAGLTKFVGELASDFVLDKLVSKLTSKTTKRKYLRQVRKLLSEASKQMFNNQEDKTSGYAIDLKSIANKTLTDEDIKSAYLDETSLEEMLDSIKEDVATLVGGNLFEALTDTFKELSTNDALIKESYNSTFLVSEAIRRTLYEINDFPSKFNLPKEFINFVDKQVNDAFGFILGNKNNQQLNVNKLTLDTTAYETGEENYSLLEGGNRMVVNYDGTQLVTRSSNLVKKSAASFILPGDTHLRDAVAMYDAVIKAKIAQVYDAAIANGKNRVLAEFLADLGFYEQTMLEKHIIDYTLESVSKTRKNILKAVNTKEGQLALEKHLAQIASDNGIKTKTVAALLDTLEKQETALKEAKAELDAHRAEKKQKMLVLSQYGVNAKTIFKNGEIVALEYVSNGKTTRIEDFGGKPLKEFTIAQLKNELTTHFQSNFDDVQSNPTETLVDTEAIENETFSKLEQELRKKVEERKLRDEAEKADSTEETNEKKVKPTSKKFSSLIMERVNLNGFPYLSKWLSYVKEGKEMVVFDYETNLDPKYNNEDKNLHEATPNEVYAVKGKWVNGKFEVSERLHLITPMDALAGKINADFIADKGWEDVGYNTKEALDKKVAEDPSKKATVAEMKQKMDAFIGDLPIVTFNGTEFDVKIIGKDNNEHLDLRNMGIDAFKTDGPNKYKGKLIEFFKEYVNADFTDAEAHSADFDVKMTYELMESFMEQLDNVKNNDGKVMKVETFGKNPNPKKPHFKTKRKKVKVGETIQGRSTEDTKTQEDLDNDAFMDELDSLPDEDVIEVVKDMEDMTRQDLSQSNILEVFNRIMELGSKPEEQDMLTSVMNTLVAPIMKADDLMLLDLLETTTDKSGARGHASIAKGAERDSIYLFHPADFDYLNQSSSEVFVHELVHILGKYLFSNQAIAGGWAKERAYIENLYDQTQELINDDNYQDWFGPSDSAYRQYTHVFKQSNKNIALAEFTAYALSSKTFADKLNNSLSNTKVDLINKPGVGGLIGTILKKLVNMINSLFGRKEKQATHMITNILLEVNGLSIKKKNILGQATSKIFDYLKSLDARIKYYDPRLRDSGLISRAITARNLARERLPSVFNSKADRGNIQIFLADILPSSESSIPYVEHAIEARTKRSSDRDIIQKEVIDAILDPNENGEFAISNKEDSLIREIVLDTDLQALYAIEGITINEITEMLEGDTQSIKTELINDIKELGEFTDSQIRELMVDIRELADGVIFRKYGNSNQETHKFINASQVTYVNTKGNDIVIDNEASIKLEGLIDALATIEVLENITPHKKGAYLELINRAKPVVSEVLRIAYSVNSKMRESQSKENLIKVKGKYDQVKDSADFIIPIVETPNMYIPSDYTKIESVDLGKGVRVSFFKVTRSVLQSNEEGMIGTLEYGDITGVSLRDNLPKANMKQIARAISKSKLANKEEIFIYTYNGKAISDIKVRVSERMEKDHLRIDDRASVILAHAEGRFHESQTIHKYNDQYLDIAEKDFQENFTEHPDDFIWVGKGSPHQDLKDHYEILTDRMKRNLVRYSMSAGKRNGFWVRKNTLRISFGARGKSIIDLLQSYNIDKKELNEAIKFVEKQLVNIGKVFKLEIVGKTYEVIYGNIVSNILLETLKGRNPLEVAHKMFEGMVEVDKLNTKRRELAKLKLSVHKTGNVSEQSRINRKIHQVEAEIKKSPVYYLDAAGFNSSFVEDITTSQSAYMSEKEKKMYDYLNSSDTLKMAKKGFDFMYMNKGSVLGDAFQRLVITSDIGSRYATDQLDIKYLNKDIDINFEEYKKLIKGYDTMTREQKRFVKAKFKTDEKAKFEKNRKKDLLEQHIDYALVSGDILTALDKLAITPFFKFKQRIAKVLYKRYGDHPATATVIGLLLAYVDSIETLGDLERAEESFWAVLSNTSGNPLSHLLEAMSPALLDNLGFAFIGD